MNEPFAYVRSYYGVPAERGRRVICYGRPGIILEDRGNYIGVNLDEDKPGRVHCYHPTDGVVYGEMGEPRKLTRSQERYARYLRVSDCFDSFLSFCRYDASQTPSNPF